MSEYDDRIWQDERDAMESEKALREDRLERQAEDELWADWALLHEDLNRLDQQLNSEEQ